MTHNDETISPQIPSRVKSSTHFTISRKTRSSFAESNERMIGSMCGGLAPLRSMNHYPNGVVNMFGREYELVNRNGETGRRSASQSLLKKESLLQNRQLFLPVGNPDTRSGSSSRKDRIARTRNRLLALAAAVAKGPGNAEPKNSIVVVCVVSPARFQDQILGLKVVKRT
jgi:hypothetical protein